MAKLHKISYTLPNYGFDGFSPLIADATTRQNVRTAKSSPCIGTFLVPAGKGIGTFFFSKATAVAFAHDARAGIVYQGDFRRVRIADTRFSEYFAVGEIYSVCV